MTKTSKEVAAPALAPDAKRDILSGQEFLPQPKVCRRYGITSMSLRRWLGRPELNFPRPYPVGSRQFYKISELLEWERQRAAVSARTK